MAMACSVAQLSSFPLDDMSTLALDQGESDLSPFFDEDWSSSPSYSLLDMSNNFFDEPETDASTHLLDDFSSLSPSGEASIDTIAAVNECQSNPTQADRIQRREEENQCFDNPPAKITIEEMINEQIKRKWCSRLPWLAFGNIPVVRFTDSFIFPVLPGAHLDLPLNTIPISGYYNVLKAALRKWIYPARSFQQNEPRHD